MCKTHDPAARKVICGAPVEDADKKAKQAFIGAIAKRTGAPKTKVERALRGDTVEGGRTILGVANAIRAMQAKHTARANQFGAYRAR